MTLHERKSIMNIKAAYIVTNLYPKGGSFMTYKGDFHIARSEKEESKDINEEFEIPDYLPEIKKLLTCRECVAPPTAYAEDGKRIFDGNIRCSVIYAGNDGRLYSVSYEHEYTFSFPSDTEDGSVSDVISVCSEGIVARAQSPRKVTVKGRLKAVYAMQSEAKSDECITEEGIPSSCEALCNTVESARLDSAEPEVFELADEMVNDMGCDSPRIIYCESNALISDTAESEGKIIVRGEVNTEMLWCDDTLIEAPRVIKRKTPFSYTLSAAEVSEGTLTCASIACVSSEATMEDSGIIINLRCAVKVLRVSTVQKNICSDIYSTTNKLTPTEKSFDTYLPLACTNKNMSVNFAASASEVGMSPSEKVVCAFASAYVDKITCGDDNGRESVSGRTVFKIITVNDSDENNEYDCKELSTPFRYEISRDRAYKKTLFAPILLPSVSATRTFARYDGKRVGLDTELSLSLFALGKQKNAGVSSVTVGARITKDPECIKIVYPDKGETLWSLAKRTSSPIIPLALKNGIPSDVAKDSAESLLSVKYVIL